MLLEISAESKHSDSADGPNTELGHTGVRLV